MVEEHRSGTWGGQRSTHAARQQPKYQNRLTTSARSFSAAGANILVQDGRTKRLVGTCRGSFHELLKTCTQKQWLFVVRPHLFLESCRCRSPAFSMASQRIASSPTIFFLYTIIRWLLSCQKTNMGARCQLSSGKEEFRVHAMHAQGDSRGIIGARLDQEKGRRERYPSRYKFSPFLGFV